MFKNTCFFKLQNDFNVDNLESQLSEFQFSPCGKHQPSSMGWVSALGHGSKALTHESQGRILIRLRHEGKILPVKVIKELVDDKVNEIKRIEDRPVKKKEKDQIKEDIIYSMLPQAFVQSSYIMAYIDTVSNLLVVDAPSRIKSNDFTAMLRKSIGSLPIDPVKETLDISDILTKWLTSCDLPDNLTLDDNVILQSTEKGGSKATLKNEYLTGEEVKKHLDLGKISTQLGLFIDDDYGDLKISFKLNSDISIKSIKFHDLITEQNGDIPVDDKLCKADADFTLYSAELSLLLVDLIAAVE